MVRQRTVVSIVGMAIGIVAVVALGLMGGLTLFSSLTLSVIGAFVGGWAAEQAYSEESSTARSDKAGPT